MRKELAMLALFLQVKNICLLNPKNMLKSVYVRYRIGRIVSLYLFCGDKMRKAFKNDNYEVVVDHISGF